MMVGTEKGRVLVVDDEPNAIKVLSAILREEHYLVLESNSVDQAIKLMACTDVDAVVTDIRMPDKDGFMFFDYITKHYAGLPVLFLTAYGNVESAVATMTSGAYYYFIKPPDYRRLKDVLADAVVVGRLKREIEGGRGNPDRADNPVKTIGNSPEMYKLLETINTVRDSESSVLISGETGTGKEVVARSLHFNGKWRDKPFVAINCAAMPKELIEAELFGHEKGAFTGAVAGRQGKFQEASGGTIFLDEIGELELSLQAKLLRVLQEKEIVRLGSNKRIPVKFRLISSTNRNLAAEILRGNFREDLYYRINVVCIKMPPLRERIDDVPFLVREFIREFCARENKTVRIADEVMEFFMNYNWPGNVRQLKNVIERAVILAKGKQITLRELPEEMIAGKIPSSRQSAVKTLRELESEALNSVLDRCKGNKSKAAKMLGISRKALYNKLNKTFDGQEPPRP